MSLDAAFADLIPFTDDLDQARQQLTRRVGFSEPKLGPDVQARYEEVFGEAVSAREAVDRIVRDVAAQGDTAVRRYTDAFDQQAPADVAVQREEMTAAWRQTTPDLQRAMERAAKQIRGFHEQQRRTHWFSASDLGIYGQLIRPLERIGIYTPGGSAAYPSSLLMTAIPARVAGVEEVIVCAPPNKEGHVSRLILAAAALADVDQVFAVGGAQAIAAMAFGTETIPHVDKIFGPGNIFVALAKQRVYGVVGLDQLAGPTETLLIADHAADADLVAADMLAQAEHDPMASAILLTTSQSSAHSVALQIRAQLETLPRASIALASL